VLRFAIAEMNKAPVSHPSRAIPPIVPGSEVGRNQDQDGTGSATYPRLAGIRGRGVNKLIATHRAATDDPRLKEK